MLYRVGAVSPVNLCMLEMLVTMAAACRVTTCVTKRRMCV